MKLAAKLTAVLFVVFVMAFGLQAMLLLRQTAMLQERELRDDLATAARALSSAAARIWELDGETAARAFLDDADKRRAKTRIRLVDAVPEGGSAQSITYEDVRRKGDVLTVAVPVVVSGTPMAGIELYRSVESERASFTAAVRTQLGLAVALALVCGALAMVLGFRFIGRPVEALVSQARAISRGQFDAVSTVRRRDELGRLAAEMNIMASQLAEAEASVNAARSNSAAVQERLRHADRLSTLGRLASSLAHELGTPLNVVSGRAGLIISDASAGPKAHKNANVIIEQTRSMTAIIQQILDFARRRRLNKEKRRVSDVVEQAVSLLEPLANAAQVRFMQDGDLELEAQLDQQKALQVLTNLMINGMQAMRDGGTMTLCIDQTRFEDSPAPHCEAGSYVRIDVRDEGRGMTEEQLERVFEPFYTTRGDEKGTGLGLSVCQGILREHDGFLEVDSTPEEGSCFSVYLPLAERS